MKRYRITVRRGSMSTSILLGSKGDFWAVVKEATRWTLPQREWYGWRITGIQEVDDE